MRRVLIGGLIILFIFPLSVNASFVNVKSDGEIITNVLASESELTADIPKASSLEVKEAGNSVPGSNVVVHLSKDDERISMVIDSGTGRKEYSFSEWKDSLIEIEERPQVNTLQIGLIDGKFSLVQKNLTAITIFPISVDAKSARISVTTDRGDRLVSVLPYQAVQNLVKAKVLNKVTENRMDLMENESELSYKITGQRIINFFDVYKYPVDLTAYVSASTGEVNKIEAPIWWKAVGFLFT